MLLVAFADMQPLNERVRKHILVDATVSVSVRVHFIQLYLNKRCKSFSTKSALMFKNEKARIEMA